MAPPSRIAKRNLLHLLVVEMEQTCQMVLDPRGLGPTEASGFPAHVLEQYTKGIALYLNPRDPLQLDLDSDPQAFTCKLSFKGRVHPCRVPWKSVVVLGVGFLGGGWEHEDADDPGLLPAPAEPAAEPALRPVDTTSPAAGGPEAGQRRPRPKRPGHLKLVK